MALLSFVLFHSYHLYFAHFKSVPVARICCTNLQPTFELLLAMDLSSSSMISFLIRSSINIGHPSCFSMTFIICVSPIVIPVRSGALRYVKFICCQSYCKSVDLISLCLLHCFQSLLKLLYGARCILSFLERVVSFHRQPSSF
jgi:hypothetical protein